MTTTAAKLAYKVTKQRRAVADAQMRYEVARTKWLDRKCRLQRFGHWDGAPPWRSAAEAARNRARAYREHWHRERAKLKRYKRIAKQAKEEA